MVPDRLLRDLTLLTPAYEVDAYGASVSDGEPLATTIRGRIDQKSRSESLAANRQGQVSEWALITNSATVTTACQIVDGAATYEVSGTPWPVYGRHGVHHYEASLRLVAG